jgi:membrane-associated protein
VLWSLAVVLVGYFAGESFGQAEKYLGTGAAIVLGVVIVALIGVWLVRRHRSGDREST